MSEGHKDCELLASGAKNLAPCLRHYGSRRDRRGRRNCSSVCLAFTFLLTSFL